MSIIRSAPYYEIPYAIRQQSQQRPIMGVLLGVVPNVPKGTQYVYQTVLTPETSASVAQSATRQINNISIRTTQLQSAVYMLSAQAEWNEYDVDVWNATYSNLDLVSELNIASEQGINTMNYNLGVYGTGAAAGQGVFNAPNVTRVNLEDDSNGQNSFQQYPNGEMLLYLLNLIADIDTRTYNLAEGMVIYGPGRIVNPLRKSNIVPLATAQQAGGGTQTVGSTMMNMIKNLEWIAADDLKGKGDAGADALIISAKTIGGDEYAQFSTNVYGSKEPANQWVSIMAAAGGQIIRKQVPISTSVQQMSHDYATTPGFTTRPEAVTILSVPYTTTP